ncbi:sentrin-specific protease 5 [Python bivittatus]|uniref:Sentrin-specific protease 5 n=1 Tax=Python bivittatus TaxID=176946 RepID=A0A9F5IKH7_PYTBI|nr:sentrin-specific protease 5 [Python bivittatus]XP_007434932.1 sentrin-specific protease 5 [Python bivittatus]XP_007434933.1 sentrin-specific protease 5 [Python bivittatus]XP_025026725.1 sentrin-specific protease 5 [Python bivittatus]
MKEHSKNLQWRSLLLASCRKWTVGLWGLRQRCFQKKRLPLLKRKKQSSLTSLNVKQIKPYRRKAVLCQRSWVPDVFLNVNPLPVGSIQNRTCPQNTFRKPFSSCECGTPCSGSRELHSISFQSELLAKSSGLGVDSEVCQDKQFSTEASITGLSLKRDSLALSRGDSNDESNGIIILNNSTRKYCCRGLKQNGTRGLLIIRRPKFNQCTLKTFLFMMYKKLSMVKFRIRIAKSLPKLRRGKTCKLNKSKLSWVAKVARDWQEDFHVEAFTDGCRALLPSWESRRNSPWDLFCLSDMNNNMPGPLIEESQTRRPDACLTQDRLFHCRELHYKNLVPRDQNGIAETCVLPELHKSASSGTETMHKAEMGEMPSLDSCPEDIFISITEKEISVSGHEGEESNQVMSADEVVLESSKLDLGTSDDCSNGPVLVELVQNEDSRSQMEVEGPISMDVFGAELLDHPYCKSPLDEPLRGSTGQKSGTPKSGKRSSQKVSCVNDEQLAVWLCGFLDEVIKKYGSLVPLCEKDVMGRLKEVFNEDFSHRKPFITKEIMKYQTRHPKSSTCNFRVFYNKHMLDMDDLTTLDGQNWLNDQIINMYGELIMDAVPDKVHFFNSFFHRQLVTKGYNGVKRWTKKVDLFKKTLLLIPIHLEVHWSLITVNLPNRIISFYDSQGIHFKFCVENIRKYLLTEAREKNHPDFLQGWQTAVTKCIPQQKNDSDCGVFVLQYCKCLALDQSFQFSQEDMPRVRKRIYKELCECRLID